MRIEVSGTVVQVTKRQVRDLERVVNWLDHQPQWATCGGDLDAYGLRESGLVRTRWHGDNFVMAPTRLGWAVLVHLHPSLCRPNSRTRPDARAPDHETKETKGHGR